MKYRRTAATGMILTVMLASALYGCAPSIPVTASATPAAASVAVTVSATPQPTPTPTATAMETLAPTQKPAVGGLPPTDYYEVERNQRSGIVDKYGKEVLPCVFGSVKGIGTYEVESSGAGLPQTQFFLATPYDIHPAGSGGVVGQDGRPTARLLYNAEGTVVGEGRYTYGYWLDRNLMALCAATGDNAMGALDATGKQIIPFQYSQVVRFGPYAVGCDTVQGRLDLYNSDGVLDKTITAAISGIDVTNGFLEVRFSTFVALLDGNLQWLFKESSYQNLRALGGDRYIAYDGSVNRLVDATGKDLLGKPYQNIEPVLDASGQIGGYVCHSNATNIVAAYDAAGKLLFEKKGYSYLRAEGPYYLASLDSGAHVLDAKGEQILPNVQGDVQQWLADIQAFMVYDKQGNLSLVRPDGTALPLPKGFNMQYLGADRFLVSVDANRTGVCDSQGRWVIPADYAGLYQLNGKDKLLTAYLGEGRTGILDYEGNVVIPPVFDWVYGARDGLLNVRKGKREGLMDWTGHWVWSTSDYDQLDD